MPDAATLVNWVASGLVGLAFGLVSAWATHRFARKRDDIAWQRELAKLQHEHEQEREMAAVEFRQKMAELEDRHARESRVALKEELIKGLDHPGETLRSLLTLTTQLRKEAQSHRLMPVDNIEALPLLERMVEILEAR